MKKLLLFSLLIPTVFFTQAQKTGNLTVFSEDGDKFSLVLNGEKQNDKPQSNIRVEELPQPYYSAKIIFADSSIPSISKNLQIADLDNKMMDVTYRLRKDKTGKMKLNPYSSIEVQPDFVVPQGTYVHRFGHAVGVNETTTTTTTSNSNTVNTSVNVPGVSMSVSINDPDATTASTTTTTTTTSSSSHTNHTSNSNHNTHSNSDGCRWAMSQSDFAAAKKTVSDGSFEATKLSTAKSIVSSNCLSCDQVVAICNLFSFEDSKLDFAKYAYKYTTDPKNYFKVSNVFSFDSSKEELNKFISGD